MSIEELDEELQFQRIMLTLIDDKTPNREQAEKDIRHTIKHLERQMKQARRGTTATASNSAGGPFSSSLFPSTMNSTPSRGSNTYQGQFAFAGSLTTSCLAFFPISIQTPLKSNVP